MAKSKKSNLDDTWEAIEKSAKESKQNIVVGSISQSQAIEVFLSTTEPDYVETFFTKAKELEAVVIVGENYRLEESDIADEIEVLREDNALDEDDVLEDDLEDEDLERFQELKKIEKEVGSITKINLSFITKTNLIFSLEIVSSIHEFIFTERGDDNDVDDEDEDGNDYQFMRSLTPSVDLAKIIGSDPLPRTEIVKKLWAYIKKHNLQDSSNRRNINADDKLLPIFGKAQVSMFEMTKLVSKHLK